MDKPWIIVLTIVSILVAIGLLLWVAKLRKKEQLTKNGFAVSLVSLAFIIFGISFGLATKDSPIPADQIIMVDALVVLVYAATMTLLVYMKKRSQKPQKISNQTIGFILSVVLMTALTTYALLNHEPAVKIGIVIMVDVILVALSVGGFLLAKKRQKEQTPSPLSTKKIAFLGIIIGLSSALMLLGFPIIPGFHFLKVELSGLIIFMTLIWFDWKTAAVVSLYTNFIHVFLPGSLPVILFLDEGINFIATMLFLLPLALFLRQSDLEGVHRARIVAIVTSLGVVFTTISMTLYNAFINLPIIYQISMPFADVVKVFGLFNFIKWGLVAVAINLTWRRLYSLRKFGEIEDVA